MDVDNLDILKADISFDVVSKIISTEKGYRPEANTYLSQKYIDTHLRMFRGGVTKIAAEKPNRALGSPLGTYVMPKSSADILISQVNGDITQLENLLGLSPGYLGMHPVRIDIENPHGLRMPNGNEVGANEQWTPGGYTSGGTPEAVIDQVPLEKLIVTELFQ